MCVRPPHITTIADTYRLTGLTMSLLYVSVQSTTRAMCQVLALLLATAIPAMAADEAADLAAFLPSDVNAVAVVRVHDAMQTPRAVREDWAKTADERFLSGAGGIPSWVNTLVTGFLVRPAQQDEVWAATLVSVPDTVTIDSIAAREQMPVDQLEGLPSVRGRRNSFIMSVAPSVLAVRRPAVRQEAAQWAGAIRDHQTGPASDYLAAAVRTPGQVVLAIDLANMLDPAAVQAHLSMDRRLDTVQGGREQLQSLLMTLRGATFAAMVGDETTAQIRIDFDQEIGTLGLYLKPFFIDTLHEMGAAIDDFDRSDVRTDGKSLVLTSTFSDESLRRVLSLITMSPATSAPMRTAAPPASTATGTTDPAASRKYFLAVNRNIDDLQRASRRSNDYSRTAMWHENFARKIDDLPVEGVDQALIDYGSKVASWLRGLARSLRGQAVEVNAHQGTLTYDVDFTPGWASVNVWGGVGVGQSAYNVSSNLQQVRERQAAAITAGTKQRDELWGMIDQARADIDRQMKQKYGAAFGR